MPYPCRGCNPYMLIFSPEYIDKITKCANNVDITDLSDSDYVQDKGYVDNELDVYARVLDAG